METIVVFLKGVIMLLIWPSLMTTE
ncbi:hypothetical protein NC653_027263 [Populus alba x Populus x berolinensis]|uniref:Uncharacterized protein n=1 Tax=Populus alba x Populus x berolinensis TaxID=444605 RepID=A0AAD6M5H1_9ROSI|nr:hypothetical protein NC653_027263 [Populus alba x Populus x berolinensis]